MLSVRYAHEKISFVSVTLTGWSIRCAKGKTIRAALPGWYCKLIEDKLRKEALKEYNYTEAVMMTREEFINLLQ